MGAAADRHPEDPASSARANVQAALTLLAALQRRGLAHLVLCPGSRSAPLAVAAALLEPRGLRLHTAIDERSAAFFALGLGRALGRPAAVVTTSGTAVAQLLAAAVEADLGTLPLLLLSADRPQRLKNCGANQAVPQEHFLQASCRRLLQGPPQGLALAPVDLLERLAAEAMAAACGDGQRHPAGPVHLNLPFEEPLHVSGSDLAALSAWLDTTPLRAEPLPVTAGSGNPDRGSAAAMTAAPRLDPDQPGVVVAGPWRGAPQDWPAHCDALRRWQRRSGWPVLADPLSCLRGLPELELIGAYDPLLEELAAAAPLDTAAVGQVLRLGPLPASRRLQRWLQACGGRQVLISQGDPRRLDPLATVGAADQWSGGLAAWVEALLGPPAALGGETAAVAAGTSRWPQLERQAQMTLERELPLVPAGEDGPLQPRPSPRPPTSSDGQPAGDEQPADGRQAAEGGEPLGGGDLAGDGAADLNEPWLARALSRLLPADLPVMLASSSPVRDWESFADPQAAWRPMHGFRGASGIDGTLSLACGLAEACGRLVLVSGDLALLHDANGWLWSRQLRGRLTVVLIENGGGGIFEQLPIRTQPPAALDFERLFAMPQPIDQLALAGLHGVPGRRVRQARDLAADLAWALEQPLALLEVRTQRRRDAKQRQRLRRAVASAAVTAAGRMANRDPLLP